MKIVFLCKRYYTNKDLILDKFGRLYHLPIYFNRSAINVKVYTLDYKGEKVEKFDLDGVSYTNIPVFCIRRWPFLLKTFLVRCWTADIDVVIASGDSHIGFLGLVVSKLKGARFVFDVYDQYKDFSSNRIPLMKWMYRKSLIKADLVFCASMKLVEYVNKFNKNAMFLPNGVDPLVFKIRDRLKCQSKLGLPKGKLVIGYFGSMEKMRGVDILLKAVGMLRSFYPNVHLLIAGKKTNEVDLESDWVDYRGQVSQDWIAYMICACDVVVIPYRESALVDFGNSCKTAEYIASGVPIVATEVKNITENYIGISELMGGALCKPGNVASLVDALKYQIQNRLLLPHTLSPTWEALALKAYRRLKEL